MKFTRDFWLAFGLLLTLIVIMFFVALGQQQDQSQLPALTSISNAPEGALALKLWLRQMNYSVLDELLSSFELPQQAKIVLVLEPSLFQEDEFAALDDWVKNGGTLIVAGDIGITDLAEHFDFKLAFFDSAPENLMLQTPLFLNPVIKAPLPAPSTQFQPVFYFVPSRSSYVTYVAAGGKPVLVSFDLGQGRVILSSSPYPFSNIGLKQEGNPALLLNLLGYAKQQGPVWFDEWHHGFRGAGNAIGPDNWLRYTPLGRSILFVVLVIFLMLLLQGRAFGRPVPLPHELRRRGALEHVTAMANLSRLAGHRKSVLLQYHHELKRTLGRRYRLDPTLPDPEYVAYLVRYNPAIDGQVLLALLARLQQTNNSETEMVRAAAEAAKWIKE